MVAAGYPATRMAITLISSPVGAEIFLVRAENALTTFVISVKVAIANNALNVDGDIRNESPSRVSLKGHHD